MRVFTITIGQVLPIYLPRLCKTNLPPEIFYSGGVLSLVHVFSKSTTTSSSCTQDNECCRSFRTWRLWSVLDELHSINFDRQDEIWFFEPTFWCSKRLVAIGTSFVVFLHSHCVLLFNKFFNWLKWRNCWNNQCFISHVDSFLTQKILDQTNWGKWEKSTCFHS